MTALKNTSGATVAYLATNPNAQFILANVGAYANSGRNILSTPRINNIDLTIAKNFVRTERFKLQLRSDMFNAINHPQYTLGRDQQCEAAEHVRLDQYVHSGESAVRPVGPGLQQQSQGCSNRSEVYFLVLTKSSKVAYGRVLSYAAFFGGTRGSAFRCASPEYG